MKIRRSALIIAEGRDITPFKLAQAELKENQIRLDAILQSLAEGLYQLDEDGRLVFLNATGAKMLGYEVKDLLGKLMNEVIRASDSPDQESPVPEVIKRGGIENREDKFRRRDGSLMSVQLLSAPLIEDGLNKGVVVSFYDITARNEAQSRANIQFALTNMLSQADSLETAVPTEAPAKGLSLHWLGTWRVFLDCRLPCGCAQVGELLE